MYRSCIAILALAVVVSAVRVSAADLREEPVTVTIPAGTLSGTLMLPPGNGPFPVALIIAGSGVPDRNGNQPGLATDAYKKLAQGLAGAGIATLRYDKRFSGESAVKQTEEQVRFDDYVNDALVFTKYLERDPRFTKVAIIGHSEGSLVGMIAAQRDAHVAAFVSLEGPGRDLGTIIDEQFRNAPGVPPSMVAQVESIDAALRAGKTVPNPGPALALFRPSVQPYLISEYKYDPAKELAKLAIPVLIIHGTTDIQVSANDAKLLAAADPKAQFVVIDGMNHVLVNAPIDRDGNIATYSQPALPLNAKLVPTIAQFLRS